MKKHLLFLLLVLVSFSGYSQLSEGFENTTGPNALPSTTWTLSSGNWAVFDNGVGTTQRWNFINFVTNPPAVNSGTNAAYIRNENIGQGNTSEDYLVTPLVTVPANGELRFFTRTNTAGDQGGLYKIKIAPSTASQTNAAAFDATLPLQTWTETTLNTTYNIYEEKVVNLSAYAGQQIYIMFDMSITQTTGNTSGDRWLVDDVRVVQNCGTPAPTATAQVFCSTATVADLVATGTNIQWYSASLGGTALPSTTALTNGTYYATQTISGCESISRTAVSVTANSIPTGLSTSNITTTSLTLSWNIVGTPTSWQVLALPCNSTAPTATATGWITSLGNSYVLTGLSSYTCYDLYVRSVCSGNSYSDWSSPTSATTLVGAAVCGGNYVDSGGTGGAGGPGVGNYSNNADSITVICPTISTDVVTVTFSAFNVENNNDGMYVFNGNSIAATQISSTNGAGTSTATTAPGSYWGNTIPGPFTSTSANGCLTFRFKSNNFITSTGWVANIVCAPPAPTAPSPQTFCNTGTIADLVANGLTGATFRWYSTATGGTAIPSTTALATGTYYVSQFANGEESLGRATVNVILNVTQAPTASAQLFCNTTANVSNLVATGTALKWYNVATGGTALSSNTNVTTGTYYVTQTLNSCESPRTSVAVTVTSTPNSSASPQTFCNSATVANLVATGTNLKWYIAATGGSVLPSTTAVFSGTYYVTQTNLGCESPTRIPVSITVNLIPLPTAAAQTFCNIATVANLVATGTAIKWYSVATGGTALAFTANVTTGTYYVTQTLLGCESLRNPVSITVNSPLPTANTQNFCVSGTVANLVATGSNIQWYAASTGGTPLASTTALAAGTYYVTQTISGCESPRKAVTVNIYPLPAAPTTPPTQTLCGGSKVSNLTATGTGIKWYLAATGGTALATTTNLITGNYYATQTVNGCESATRTLSAVTINTTPTPTAAAQTFCNTATVSNLVATGTSIKWYAAATGGTALASTATVTTGTYYVTQTLNSCESARLSVSITVNSPLPTVSDQSFCASATVSNLVATGTNIKWYDTATGGTSLLSTTSLISATYYATQTISGCESPRNPIVVTINNTSAPIAQDQSFCNSATIADLVATGTSIKWYAAATGGTSLSTSTALVSGTTYYASQTLNNCESIRTAVLATVNTTSAPTATGLTYCNNITVADLTATGSNLLWYSTTTGGTPLATTTAVATGNYYVSQTVNNCESTRTSVAVAVVNSTPTNLTTSNITTNSITLNWSIVGAATSWEVLALPCGTAAPDANSIDWTATNSNSYTISGLFSYTCYDLYVRSVCPGGIKGTWAGPRTATTLVGSAVCGGNYVDAGGTGGQGPNPGNYPSNADTITVICPTIATDVVTVTFSTFNIETGNDGMYIFNGNSIAATQISSTNGAGTSTATTAPGAFWGTTIPGPFTSTSADGCLTFRFKSNNNTTRTGWIANIVCAPPAPTAPANQTFCNAATVSNLVANGLPGSTFDWYTTATGGTALTSTTALVFGTYYVSQTVNGEESVGRATVNVIIDITPAPTANDQLFCNTTATVSSLLATGTSLKWYNVATGGTALASTTNITSGIYYVSQTINSCESLRTPVVVTVTSTPIATASAQVFCNSATVSDLTATGSNLKWYISASVGAALSANTTIFSGTYYVTQTLNGCESPSRTSVSVTVNSIPAASANSQSFCEGATVSSLVATGTAIKWYSAATGGTALAGTTSLSTGTYYVTQTLLACESATRTLVSVTVNTTAAPTASAQTFCTGATVSS